MPLQADQNKYYSKRDPDTILETPVSYIGGIKRAWKIAGHGNTWWSKALFVTLAVLAISGTLTVSTTFYFMFIAAMGLPWLVWTPYTQVRRHQIHDARRVRELKQGA